MHGQFGIVAAQAAHGLSQLVGVGALFVGQVALGARFGLGRQHALPRLPGRVPLQLRLEPLLRDHAERRNPGGVLFGHELEDLEQDDEGVTATIAGVFLSVLLGSGLFALAFYSSKSGHDERSRDATGRPRRD